MKSNRSVIVFDADGVLMDNNMGSMNEILVLLGKEAEVKVIFDEYQRKKHLRPWGLEQLALLYKGERKEKLRRLAKEYCYSKLMPGAVETANALKGKGYRVGVITSGPDFIFESLKEILSFDFAFGTILEYKDGAATGFLVKKVDRNIKKDVLAQMLREEDIEKDKVIVIGDSITDLPMGELVGKFIAFNPHYEEVKQRADIIIEKKDLKELLKYL